MVETADDPSAAPALEPWRTSKKLRISLACLMSAWCCLGRLAVAHAQTVDVMVRGTSATEEVRAEAFDDTTTTSVVGEEDTKDAAAQSTPDALRSNAMVSVQQTTPGQGTVYVRGFSGRAVGHSVDGVRLNTAVFRAGNNPYLGLLDPYAMDHYEVVPGAQSVEYGSDALGGHLAAYTTTPGYSPRETYRDLSLFQSLTSNPLGTSTHLASTYSSGWFGAHAGFTYIRAGLVIPGGQVNSPVPSSYLWLERVQGDAYQPETSEAQVGTEFEFYAGNLTLRKRLAPKREVFARAQYSVRPSLIRYDQITPRFKNEIPARAQDQLEPMSRTMVSVELVERWTGAPFNRLGLLAAWQNISERSLVRRLNEVCLEGGLPSDADPADGCAEGSRLVPAPNRTEEKNASNAFTLRATLDSATQPASPWTLGVELHGDIISSKAKDEDLATGNTVPVPGRFADGSFLGEAGLFGQTRVPLGDLTVVAGARASMFLLQVAPRPAPDPTDAYDRTLPDYAAELGVHWQFHPGIAMVANVGRGARSPNVEDLSAVGSRRQGRFQIPNDDLGSEHSYTADVGLKVLLDDLFLQTAAFVSRYEDAIVLGPTTVDGASVTPEGDAYYHSVNAGRIDYVGLESQFSLPIAEPLALFGRWLSMMGTQYNQDSTDLPPETPADRVPPHQGEIGLEVMPTDDIEISVSSAWRAAQTRLNDPVNLDDNRIPAGGTPGYTTFHARVAYALSRGVKLRLAGDNLTDEVVLEHGSGFYLAGFSTTASIDVTTTDF